MAPSGRPASFSTRASSSTNATPSRAASAGPMVLLPAPAGRSAGAGLVRRRAALLGPARAQRPRYVLQARNRDVRLAALQFGEEPLGHPAPLGERAAGKGPLLPETADGGADGGEEDLVLASHAVAV